jgi:3-oxoacyl-[acyl-carrier-protein] synthase II
VKHARPDRGETPVAVITGLGVVSPLGLGKERFWRHLRQGRSGISRLSTFDLSGSAPECRIGAEVLDFRPTDWMDSRIVRSAGRFSQFAVAATRMALDDSGIKLSPISPHRIAVAIGTSMNGLADVFLPQLEHHLAGDGAAPWTAREYPGHAATAHVARVAGAEGPWATIATACAGGVDAIAWAAETIRRGGATVAVAGGTETPLSAITLEGFRLFGLLARWDGNPAEASRPFDKFRNGLVVGEGAATVVVEEESAARARGAHIYARILAWASGAEGLSRNQVEMSGESFARCVRQTLHEAERAVSVIDYVSAHGNSIPSHDTAETAGIKLALGDRAYSVPVSSIKSMCGQAFAASSAMQVIASCLSMQDGILPPTINYAEADPSCDLDYVPNASRSARVRTVLVHARGIGGSHTTMLLEAS